MTDILKITAADLDAHGFYIGKTDVTDYAGHIELDAPVSRGGLAGGADQEAA